MPGKHQKAFGGKGAIGGLSVEVRKSHSKAPSQGSDAVLGASEGVDRHDGHDGRERREDLQGNSSWKGGGCKSNNKKGVDVTGTDDQGRWISSYEELLELQVG